MAGPVVAFLAFCALRWLVGEAARLAVDTGRLAVSAWLAVWWIVVVGLAVLVVWLARWSAVRGRAVVEPADQPAPVAEVVAPAPCPYGPTCPRCTGTGTLVGTALDQRPALDQPAVTPVELHPARRPRRPRKVA